MTRLIAALVLMFAGAGNALAQNYVCPDRPSGDSTTACANTRFVTNATGGVGLTIGTTTITGGTSGDFLYDDSGVLGEMGGIASLTATDQTLSGGANVTSLSLSTGSITVDCGKSPLQYITNNGTWTITAPSNDGSCDILITNGASAQTPTFSGFTAASSAGSALNNTSGDKFILHVERIDGISTYQATALQ